MEKEKVEVGDFVYLSPSVLKGDLYISQSDVYAYGLFLIEVVAGVEAFQSYRNYSLEKFTETVDAVSMLDLDNTLVELTDSTTDIIKKCVSMSKDDRPSMCEVMDAVNAIGDEVKVIPTKSRHHRVPITKAKRTSSQTP